MLVTEREIAGYYDAAVAAGAPAKRAANWVINDVLARRRRPPADADLPAAGGTGALVTLVENGAVGQAGQGRVGKMWTERRTATDIVAAEGLAQSPTGS